MSAYVTSPDGRDNSETIAQADRLAWQPGQSATAILAGAHIGQRTGRHVGQAQGVIQLAVSQQSGIGSNRRTVELECQAAVEIGPQSASMRPRHNHRYATKEKAGAGETSTGLISLTVIGAPACAVAQI